MDLKLTSTSSSRVYVKWGERAGGEEGWKVSFPVLFVEWCFFNRTKLKGWTGHCCKENNKIGIKLHGRLWNGTHFRGNFFSHPQTKELVDLGVTVIPIPWYQIRIPSGPQCHNSKSTSLFGQKSLCTHACNWSYMKGNPSDWEYEKPSYDTIMMLVIWHFQLQFCSVGESLCQTPHWHFQRQKFPHSWRFNCVLGKSA